MILLYCGATSNTTSLDGRIWEADPRSKYSPFNDPNASFSSEASGQNPSVPSVPYHSALIIRSNFTFNFPVLSGPKFLRLYFYPETYSGRDTANSFFSVTANSYTLLNNFSASLTAPAMVPPVASFIKEYVVTVWDSQMLNVTFTPSPGSFAFINAIEIVSMPSGLYVSGSEIPFVPTNANLPFTFDNTTALETMYRLNVGGRQIENTDDTGIYRTWREDGQYLAAAPGVTVFNLANSQINYTSDTPAYSAPKEVYTTLRNMGNDPWFNLKVNLTWNFTVDAGFNYLVRLHLCELLVQVTKRNQHVFNIFINNQKAEEQVDVFDEAGGSGIPIHKDYIVLVGDGITVKELRLDLHPADQSSEVRYPDAFLNGLEIFKLNRTAGSLAGPNPDPVPRPQPPEPLPKSDEKPTILPIVGAILGGFALFSLILIIFIFQRRRKPKDSLSFTSKFSTKNTSSSLPSDLCRHFSIAEIIAATEDFHDRFLIGSGGFGNVYRGIIDGGTTIVAIKRLNASSWQGAHEFRNEITMLSELRHIHLVSLIGYCDDHDEMILVYDYMPHGTLRDHLYNTENPPLSWKRRLEICIGAARGLQYLHREAKHSIIHRDVKSSNILLDENYVAKVSDFGLSKLGPMDTSQTHVSTVVKGSFGYVDPEYYLRQHLTEKSDVYSFGVVLLEVLSGRPPVIQGVSKEKASLAHWARSCYLKGQLDQIVDRNLTGQIAPMALKKFGEMAERCVRDRGTERPTMTDIVWALEFTVQLQETLDKEINGSNGTTTDEDPFSGSSKNVAKSQESTSDIVSSIAASDRSFDAKISGNETSTLLLGTDN